MIDKRFSKFFATYRGIDQVDLMLIHDVSVGARCQPFDVESYNKMSKLSNAKCGFSLMSGRHKSLNDEHPCDKASDNFCSSTQRETYGSEYFRDLKTVPTLVSGRHPESGRAIAVLLATSGNGSDSASRKVAAASD